MRQSVIRVVLAVGVVAAGGLVWTDAGAATAKDINATIDPGKCDKTWGPPCFTPANGSLTSVEVGDTITWHATDGTHTVTPVDSSAFAGSGDLTGPDGVFSVTFDKPGSFSFYCKHHGSVEDGGKIHHGMWGRVEVKGPPETTTTTAPNAPPPSPPPGTSPPPPTDPTRPSSPPPSSSPPPPSTSNGSTGSNGNGQTAAGSGRPWVGPPPTQAAAPPPTRVAASNPPPSDEEPTAPRTRDKKDGGNNDSNSSEATAPPPDAAVLPPSPQFPTPTTAPLADSSPDAPHGDSIAVLKNEPGGRHRKLVMFGTVFGFGLFAAGVGGWKFTHRSSKYWPA